MIEIGAREAEPREELSADLGCRRQLMVEREELSVIVKEESVQGKEDPRSSVRRSRSIRSIEGKR